MFHRKQELPDYDRCQNLVLGTEASELANQTYRVAYLEVLVHLLRLDLEEFWYVEDDWEDGDCADEEPEGALREQLVGPGNQVTYDLDWCIGQVVGALGQRQSQWV